MKDEMTCGEFGFFLYENGSLLDNRVSLTLNPNIFTPVRNNFKNIKWSRICQTQLVKLGKLTPCKMTIVQSRQQRDYVYRDKNS